MTWVSDIFNQLEKLLKCWVIILPWQLGVRVRFGKNQKLLQPGVHFKIPFFDEVKVNSVRLHFITVCPQTLTSKSLETITIAVQIGYTITDIQKVYNAVSGIEEALHGVVVGCVSETINNNTLSDIKKESVEVLVKERCNGQGWGVEISQVNIITYAVVKTFRIIKDDHWVNNGMKL